jgi:hypothetical protein
MNITEPKELTKINQCLIRCKLSLSPHMCFYLLCSNTAKSPNYLAFLVPRTPSLKESGPRRVQW